MTTTQKIRPFAQFDPRWFEMGITFRETRVLTAILSMIDPCDPVQSVQLKLGELSDRARVHHHSVIDMIESLQQKGIIRVQQSDNEAGLIFLQDLDALLMKKECGK